MKLAPRSYARPACTAASCAVLVAACSGLPAGDGRPNAAEYGVVAAPPLPTAVPAVEFDRSDALADVDGSVVALARDGELVIWDRDAADAEPVPVSPTAELRVVSASGAQTALFELLDGDRSRITVVDRRGPSVEVTEYDLPGLVEPEAFSTDGGELFVIDHQASTEPGAYRVRPFDLATGRLGTILGPTKTPFEDDMNGVGRRQAWSPRGDRLYTLYIRQTHHHHDDAVDDGADHGHGEPGTDGFVHVLDLAEEWAFCLDLPPEFGHGDLATTALAVSPDGSEVVVADVAAGRVAFASTGTLAITRTAPMPRLAVDGELQLGLTHRAIVFGVGSDLHWYDRFGLRALADAPVPLGTPLAGITSNGAGLLAWTTDQSAPPIEVLEPGNARAG